MHSYNKECERIIKKNMRSSRRLPGRRIIRVTKSESGNPRGIACIFPIPYLGFFVAWGKQSQ